MLRSFLIIALLILSLCSPAQTLIENTPKKFGITIAPLPLIPIDNHAYIRIGLDLKLSNRFRFFTEGGYALNNEYYGKTKGYTIKTELKMNIFKDKRSNAYWAIRYYYKNENVSTHATIKIDSIPDYNLNYSIDKKLNAFTFKIGDYQTISKKTDRIGIDYFFGLGIRNNNITCSGINSLEAINRDFGDSFVFPLLYRCNSGLALDVDLGFRLILWIT